MRSASKTKNTHSIETFISRESVDKSPGKSKYQLKTFDMGKPAIIAAIIAREASRSRRSTLSFRSVW